MENYATDDQKGYAEEDTCSMAGRWHMAVKVILHAVRPMIPH